MPNSQQKPKTHLSNPCERPEHPSTSSERLRQMSSFRSSVFSVWVSELVRDSSVSWCSGSVWIVWTLERPSGSSALSLSLECVACFPFSKVLRNSFSVTKCTHQRLFRRFGCRQFKRKMFKLGPHKKSLHHNPNEIHVSTSTKKINQLWNS